MARVTVVGLGPGDTDLVTSGALAALAEIEHRFVRTRHHPAARLLADDPSFDEVYESAEHIDEVYPAIVERLVEAAEQHGHVLYAVPGSPLVAETSVELLLADDRVEVDIVAALSFLELVWPAVGVDPLAAGVRLVDGQRFATEAAGERGPLLVAQCDRRSVLSDIKLAVEDPPEQPVLVLSHLGLPDQRVDEVEWADLDREIEPDHLTSLYIPRLGSPVASELVRFHEVVRRLRHDCPWDRAQTHRSLRRHLLEEAHEVLEALDALPDEVDAASEEQIELLAEELGDLLFQVMIHSVMAEQEGWFDLAEVARGVTEKLISRHPHVFGSVEVGDADEVVANWEAGKLTEKGRASLVEGIPPSLPALAVAAKVHRKLGTLGVARPDLEVVLGGIAIEAGGLRGADQPDARIGQLMELVVVAAGALGVDPEEAMRATNTELMGRVRRLEVLLAEQPDQSPDQLWAAIEAGSAR